MLLDSKYLGDRKPVGMSKVRCLNKLINNINN